MSSNAGGKFEADPAKLRTFIEGMLQLGKEVEGISRSFEEKARGTANWYGFDDDYAKDVGGQAKKEHSMIVERLQDTSEACNGIIEGFLAQLREISNTQSAIMDGINVVKSATEGIGDAGGGKKGH